MANQTAGIEVQDDNPYNVVVTNSGTLIGSAVELVYDETKVLTRNDLIKCVTNLLTFLETASGTGYGPPI